jgi:diacylglycerol kinase (ATP)
MRNKIAIKKLLHSFGYAFQGIVIAFKTQQNFRIETVAAIIAIVAGFVFHITALEWLVVLLCIASVLCLELVNTALESMCDVYSTAINPTIKIVKDTAAAAVLIASFIAFVIALIIFIPKI